jgi:hypothetical protein
MDRAPMSELVFWLRAEAASDYATDGLSVTAIVGGDGGGSGEVRFTSTPMI